MAVSNKIKMMGVDLFEEKILKRKLNNSRMENVAIVNLHCLNNFRIFSDVFPRFKELIENQGYFKILYYEIDDDLNNLPTAIINWRDRKDIVYAGKKLELNKDIIRSYLNWKFDFPPFSPTS